ncbi:MAG: hypothetical protein ABFD92_10810 [Planctomycetaceae bacterium]|nr:hypothetical protein [Planctomycetaceae bacterium]
MARKIATGRIVGLVLAGVGLGFAIYLGSQARQMSAEFHQWLDARPMETGFDLSKPGEITVPFRQTCSSSHGEVLCLKCDLPEAAKQNTEQLLKGLSGSVVIKDSQGNGIKGGEITADRSRYHDGEIILAAFAPFSKGEYTATIRIDSGAPALAGKTQTIYAKYELCGLEKMPAGICTMLAGGAGLVALVSILSVLQGLLRKAPVEAAQKG